MDTSNLPIPKFLDFPAAAAVIIAAIVGAALIVIVNRFDTSGGTLTISLLVTVAFIGAMAWCLRFTIPADEATSALIGGLTAAFGAVVAFHLGRGK